MSVTRRKLYVSSCGAIVLLIFVIGWSPKGRSSAAAPLSQQPRSPLPAPTFYLALKQGGCWQNEVEVHGASNLPPGAIIDLQLAEFQGDGWLSHVDAVNATLGPDGYFTAKIPLLDYAHLPHNLIVTATFGTVYHQQPTNVLRIVGNHGEHLDDLMNPQAMAVSGFNTTLFVISRAPCGPQPPAH
jgi:hypothetical protein